MNGVTILDDEVLKDMRGNGKFTFKVEKNKLLVGKIKYEMMIYRKEDEKVSGCIFKKIIGGDKKYIFDLCFNEEKVGENTVTYTISNPVEEKTYDVLGNDVMFTAALRAEENKVLSEFDELMWLDSESNQSKSTIIDVITDVIDTTERDDAEINGVKISDENLIHLAVKGFFSEINPNVDIVEF